MYKNIRTFKHFSLVRNVLLMSNVKLYPYFELNS